MNFPLLFLPSSFVPLVVCVMVLPSLEMTVRPVTWYFPPVFLLSNVKVLASICFIEVVSQGAPVTGYSLPSYLTVPPPLMGVPSCRSPVTVVLTPTSDASFTIVRLLTGFLLGVVDVDLATFLFQVPIELSAPYIAMVVIATPTISFAMIFRIVLALLFNIRLVAPTASPQSTGCPSYHSRAGSTG